MPKTLLEKLGITATTTVAILNLSDEAFLRMVSRKTAHVLSGKLHRDLDCIVFHARRKVDLDRLATLKRSLAEDGAIWVVAEKGKVATLKDTEIIAAGVKAGLVDNKVVSFSETQTALRFVIPIKDRHKKERE